MKHNKSIKIKRSKNRLYKKKKSGAKIAAETVIFVLIAGALVFVGYSAAGPLIKLWCMLFPAGMEANRSPYRSIIHRQSAR